ncbi:MAG TPA: ribosomal protein L7/L12 [Pseudonocardiaceae bacterium]|nr:ribosomal protein L7/L12 [Pseudonocardiaceae bacterium]
MQKLAANGVEGMADLWQQPLPLPTNQPKPRPQLNQPNQFGPLANDPIAQVEPGVAMDQVRSLLMQGRKIQAIKVYRELTGVGLKEAKEAIEQLAGER